MASNAAATRDALSLTEASFCALEEAYAQERQRARLAQATSASFGHAGVSADVVRAAEQMERLHALTVRVHKRFTDIAESGSPAFTSEELASLRLLGFAPPRVAATSTATTNVDTAAAEVHFPSNESTARDEESAALRATCAQLRLRNAQLLASLAWHQLCAQHAQPHEGTSARSTSAAPSVSSTVAGGYAELKVVQERFAALCTPPHAAVGLFRAHSDARAEDVAIAELLQACAFPPQVRVTRLAASGLYLVDKPVWVSFASPQSSVLVVRDPDGVWQECTLEAYLRELYAPLLHAVQWQPPASVNSAQSPAPRSKQSSAGPARTGPLSQLSYGELAALKHAALRRLDRDTPPPPVPP